MHTRDIWSRNTNKEVIRDMGKNKFDFDIIDELIRYKYMRGVKIKRKQWRKLKENGFYNMPETYEQWERSIKEKYKAYSRKNLKEFDHYLEFLLSDSAAIGEMNSIMAASIISSVMSALFSIIVMQSMEPNENLIGTIITTIFASLGIAVLVSCIILAPYSIIRNNSMKNKMYKDYRKIIKLILKSKGVV